MDKSQLISNIIGKLKTAYPYYFKNLTEEETISLFAMYQEELGQYNEETLIEAIKEIIRNNDYMPTLKQIIDKCEANRISKRNDIIDKMYNDGYFKRGQFCELDSEQEYRNYHKALKFVEEGIIPDWLLKDMISYGYDDGKELLGTDIKMLETGETIKEEFTEEDEKEFDRLLAEVLKSIDEL